MEEIKVEGSMTKISAFVDPDQEFYQLAKFKRQQQLMERIRKDEEIQRHNMLSYLFLGLCILGAVLSVLTFEEASPFGVASFVLFLSFIFAWDYANGYIGHYKEKKKGEKK